jgi:uncharacterized protein (TIGR03435 family)
MKPLLLAVVMSIPAFSQPAFEAASVKLAADPKSYRDFRLSPGRLVITNLTLGDLLRLAYNLLQYQMPRKPDWIDDDGFDIVATAPDNPSRDQMVGMLQTLLVERFKLLVHWDTKEGTGYALSVGKNGPKFKEATGDNPPAIHVTHLGPPQRPSPTYILAGDRADMRVLVGTLSNYLGMPVFDNTGIQGEFGVKFEFERVEGDGGTSILRALQEQVGLKLEGAKGPIKTFVIDHAERPTSN